MTKQKCKSKHVETYKTPPWDGCSMAPATFQPGHSDHGAGPGTRCGELESAC